MHSFSAVSHRQPEQDQGSARVPELVPAPQSSPVLQSSQAPGSLPAPKKAQGLATPQKPKGKAVPRESGHSEPHRRQGKTGRASKPTSGTPSLQSVAFESSSFLYSSLIVSANIKSCNHKKNRAGLSLSFGKPQKTPRNIGKKTVFPHIAFHEAKEYNGQRISNEKRNR